MRRSSVNEFYIVLLLLLPCGLRLATAADHQRRRLTLCGLPVSIATQSKPGSLIFLSKVFYRKKKIAR
jgi:hypothetical protein